MNNESNTVPTSYLGREIPKDYVACINSDYEFPEWLTMFPNSQYEHSTEIEVWNKEQLLSPFFENPFRRYEFFTRDDVDFSEIQTREEDNLTPEEVQTAFAIGEVNEGILFINLHDGSFWIWYDDMFCEKIAESFSDFQNLLTEESIVS